MVLPEQIILIFLGDNVKKVLHISAGIAVWQAAHKTCVFV